MSDVNVLVGYKNTEIGFIPNDWNVAPLKSLLKEPPKYGINAPAVPLVGKLPVYIRITDITEDGYYSPEKQAGVNSQFSDSYILNDGDIVLARTGASVGKSYLYRKEDGVLVYAGFLIKISPDDKALNPSFLFQYLKTEQYWAWVIVNSMRSGQPGVNGNEYGNLPIPVPNVKEQTAIAIALSDIDNLIQSLEKLIAKREAVKTASIQQLLTGKTRLPEFATREDGSQKGVKQTDLGQIPEDWEVDEVHNLLKITTGNKNTQDKIETGKYPFFVRSQTIERINTYSFDGEGVLTAGDGVGTGKVYHYINGKFDYHQRVYLMHDFGNKINGYYFYLYFSTNFYDRIMSMNAKSSVDSVRRDMIANMKILFPSKEEQTAIATILSDMDAEIQALHARLTKTQDIKQGMMQQLLTGKVRLVSPSDDQNMHVSADKGNH